MASLPIDEPFVQVVFSLFVEVALDVPKAITLVLAVQSANELDEIL